METCEMSCVKYLLFTFNSIFALSGIALIVLGGCILHDVDRFKAFLEGTVLAPPIVLIIVGIIVFIVSFLGCCGAIKELSGMLYMFAGLLFIIFVAEIAVGALAAVNKDSFVEEMRKSMKSSKDNYNPTIPEDKRLWDELQSGLECCGVDGPDDWAMGGVYPASCCKGYNPRLHKDHLCGPGKAFVHLTGCFQKLREKINEGSNIVLGVGIGLAVVQFVGIILSCMLASTISGERKEGRHRD